MKTLLVTSHHLIIAPRGYSLERSMREAPVLKVTWMV
jgi:hypothetical protein